MLDSCPRYRPATVHIKKLCSLVWSHLFSKQKICKIFQHLVSKSKYKKTTELIILCATVQFNFSCCVCPLSQTRAFPPSGLGKNIRHYPAQRELSGKSLHKLLRHNWSRHLHQHFLWVQSAAGKVTPSLNIAHATPGYKRGNIKSHVLL